MAQDDDEREILTSLPGTRAQRPNARREAARAKAAGPKAAGAKAAKKAKAEAAPTGKRPRPAAKAGAASSPKPPRGRAKSGPTAAAKRPRPVAKEAPEPPKPRRPVRAVTGRGTPPAGYAPRRDSEPSSLPGGVELVGTAVQAAGELAQIGLAVGGQALRSALGRLARRP